MSIRTDLAIEIGEQYKDDDVEIQGVAIEELFTKNEDIKVTLVDIFNENGVQLMNRPIGKYITIENNKGEEDKLTKIIIKYLRDLTKHIKNKSILVVGLGNKDVTPDALGPFVVEQIEVTRHFEKENGMAAISPGVTGQTGMESGEIIRAIVKEMNINLVVAIDALAARSVDRLNTTIQITNTGICPGAGIGNNRKELNKSTIGVEVIAIGVPTVVDASTIVSDALEKYMIKQGLKQEEIESFNNDVRKEIINNMFVTPKDIDECVKNTSSVIAKAINEF